MLLSTAGQAMMIYPYVPIEQAANNGNPTQTPYYNATELEAVNTKAGAAVDALVERVLADIGDTDTVALNLNGQTVLAARVPRNGWLLILSRPQASLP